MTKKKNGLIEFLFLSLSCADDEGFFSFPSSGEIENLYEPASVDNRSISLESFSSRMIFFFYQVKDKIIQSRNYHFEVTELFMKSLDKTFG